MSATLTKKPKRVPMSAAELCEKSAPKLRELFGPRTYLGKHGVQCASRWQVLTFIEVGKHTIQGQGDSAREALAAVGLEGWVEDAERGLV